MNTSNEQNNDPSDGPNTVQPVPDAIDTAWRAAQASMPKHVIPYRIVSREESARLFAESEAQREAEKNEPLDLVALLSETDDLGSLHNGVRCALRRVIKAYHAFFVADGNDGPTTEDIGAMLEAVAMLQVRVGMRATYTVASDAVTDYEANKHVFDDVAFVREGEDDEDQDEDE